MRSFLILLLCCYFSYGNVQANNYSSVNQASSPLPPPHHATTSVQQSNRYINHPEKPVQTIKSAPAKPNPVISGVTGGCVRPGDILNFTGKDLSALSNPVLTLNAGDNAIKLKSLSVTNTHITSQVSNDKRLQANHTYPVYLLEQGQLKNYRKTNLFIRTCLFTASGFKEKSSSHHEPGEILIFADKQQVSTIRKNAIKSGYKILRHHELTGLDKTMLVLSVEEQMINDVMADLRLQYPDIEIDLNHHYRPAASPRTYASEQIAWPEIKPCYSKSYKNIAIGIIDSYVDQNHPALAGQNITVKNFLQETDQADVRHGTAIAAILTGNKPDFGFQGLLHGVRIMAASAIRQDKKALIATTEGLVRSLDWLIVQNVRLINISLSGTTANFILKSAFQRGIKKGLIIFAAAGNLGQDTLSSYPAALPGVIAVTAIDVALHHYPQANQGEYIDFSAPGVDIWTVDKGLQGKYRSGTSYAAPHALAVAALYLGRNPSLSRDILYNAMQANVRDLGVSGHDTVFGWGLIQTPKNLCR